MARNKPFLTEHVEEIGNSTLGLVDKGKVRELGVAQISGIAAAKFDFFTADYLRQAFVSRKETSRRRTSSIFDVIHLRKVCSSIITVIKG